MVRRHTISQHPKREHASTPFFRSPHTSPKRAMAHLIDHLVIPARPRYPTETPLPSTIRPPCQYIQQETACDLGSAVLPVAHPFSQLHRPPTKMRPDGPRDPIAGPDVPEPPFPLKLGGKVIKGFGRGSKEVS